MFQGWIWSQYKEVNAENSAQITVYSVGTKTYKSCFTLLEWDFFPGEKLGFNRSLK
jgi:hypothetical protein